VTEVSRALASGYWTGIEICEIQMSELARLASCRWATKVDRNSPSALGTFWL